MSSTRVTCCPLCFAPFPTSVIAAHASNCMGEKRACRKTSKTEATSTKKPFPMVSATPKSDSDPEESPPPPSPPPPPIKKKGKVGGDKEEKQNDSSSSSSSSSSRSSPPPPPLPILKSKKKKKELPPPPQSDSNLPLAEEMRPKLFKEFIRPRKKERQHTQSHSMGSSSCGKTSIANIILQKCKDGDIKAKFVKMSACVAAINDVREAVTKAKK
ncbi:ycaJ [Lepeophtheirus salmonis]|uniref:YcaJ n=1 Tax=Lepeophtheirus salmonis TaxID=72036 RepID=A0A7R8CXK6_LEPSM|nr:ycaJ [Lepeophtheirus salmonis]CAF2961128.1 ycaJ [Lepeophtheirus salmonis]